MEYIDVIHGLARPHDRGEDIPDDPGNPQVRHLRLKRGGYLQSVDDVPKG